MFCHQANSSLSHVPVAAAAKYAPTLPLLRKKPQKNDNLPAFAKQTNGARHSRSTAEFFNPCVALTGRSAKIG
jgi:hypothetical protein